MALEENRIPISDEDVMKMIKLADRKHGGKCVDREDFLYLMECAGLFNNEKKSHCD